MSAIISFAVSHWILLSASALGIILMPAIYAGIYYVRRARLRARRAQREAREASENFARREAFDAATRNCRREIDKLRDELERLKKAYERDTGRRWSGF